MVFHSMESVLHQYLHQLPSCQDHKIDKEGVINYIHDDSEKVLVVGMTANC